MALQEILPGVFHWTTFHLPIRARVSSYYVRSARIVIDPKVPEEGLDVLPDEPQQVVLTSGHHARDARQFCDAYGIPVRALPEAAQRLAGTLDVQPFSEGEEVAPGVTAIHIGKLSEDEGALHLAVPGGAIAFADALNHYGSVLAFFPDELLGEHPERIKAGLKDAFRGLPTREFDHLLFAHGDPLIGGGKTALREFVERPVGHEDYGQAL